MLFQIVLKLLKLIGILASRFLESGLDRFFCGLPHKFFLLKTDAGLFVVIHSSSDKFPEGPHSLAHRRRLFLTRAADNDPPEIWYYRPSGMLLWSYRAAGA